MSRDWNVANGVYIPKEQNSSDIGQFRPISLLNVEGKMFFAVLAKRLTKYLLSNGYVDSAVQKGGIPGVPGCLEHASMIWDAIQRVKSCKGDLHVVWLDLVNAYGAVPHSLIWRTLESYHVPDMIVGILKEYFGNFRMRFTTRSYTTDWTRLQVGIAMGCTVSSILLVLAMQVLLKATEFEAGCVDVGAGAVARPLKAFMDDTTVMENRADKTQQVLERLDSLMVWSRIKFKPAKSRSLSVVKGKVVNDIKFQVGGQAIPTVCEEPVKSLGRWYDCNLKDSKQSQAVVKANEEGLKKIDRTRLQGKFKVWIVQFMHIPKLLWPLMVYEIGLCAVERIEQKIGSYTRKWLGLPPGLTSVALYSRSAKLKLPLRSVVEEFKVSKVRSQMMLSYSSDEL